MAILFMDGPSGNHYACYDAGVLFSECQRIGVDTSWWFGKPNSFTMPRGEGPGFGYILLTKNELNDIDLDAYNHRLVFHSRELSPVVVDYLCVVDARAIAPNASSSSLTTMYLVRLADQRHLAGISTTLYNYNVPTPEITSEGAPIYYEGTMKEKITQDGYDPWPWEGILQDLWYQISPEAGDNGLLGPFPAFHTGAAKPPASVNPEGYFFSGLSVWKCFNRVLYDGAHTLECHADGTYKLATLSQLDDDVTDLRDEIKERYLLDVDHGIVGIGRTRYPQWVEVAFPSRNWIIHTSLDTKHATPQDAFLTDSFHTISKTTTSLVPGVNVVTNTTATLHTSFISARRYLDTNGDEVVANETDLQNVATFLSLRYATEINKDRIIHETYSDYHDFYAGSVLGSVWWGDTGDGPMTVISSDPLASNPLNPEVLQDSLSIPSLSHPRSTFLDDYKQSFYWLNERLKSHYPFQRDTFIRIKTTTVGVKEKGTGKIVYGYYNSSGVLQWVDVADDALPPEQGTVDREVTFVNLTGSALTSGDEVYRAVWDWQLNSWFIPPQGSAGITILRGLTTAQVAETDETFDIDEVTALAGSWEDVTASDVKNSSEFAWAADPDATAYVLVGSDGELYPLQVKCPE